MPLRPDPAPPAGSTTEVFVARDGTQLLAREWKATGDVKGALVIVHGLKDYSARYARLAGRAAASGFDVYAYDLRGHGRSAGPRVAPDDWNDYVDDTDRFVALVESREPGKPVFLFGHSMGGAIAARTAEVHQPKLAGLIVSGPALAIDAPPVLYAVTRMSGALTPHFPALALDDRDFSSDPANASAMEADPLISDPPAPARTAAGLVAAMHEIWRDVGRLTMPVLALHGTADKLTAPAGSRELVAAVPARDKALVIYDGYFHDLVHEPGERGPRVEGDILAWLGAHTGGPAVAAPAPYTGPLAGDAHGWTQAVEASGGIGKVSNDPNAGAGFAGRFAIELARPASVGWHASVTAHTVDGNWAVSLRPIGVAVRFGGTALGISGGGSLVTGETLALSAGAWLERPLGSLGHFTAFAQVDHRDASVYLVGGTLRIGGDRSYGHTQAGVGPVISAGGELLPGDRGWFALIGLELYGAD